MAVPRYLEQFVSIDGSQSYTFETHGMVVSESQKLRVPTAAGIGADYQHDFLGYGVSPRDPADISVSWISSKATAALVDTEIDSIRSKLLLIGKGKLYVLMADSSERWCYARATQVPAFSRQAGELLHAPQSVGLLRFSNWQATAATTGSQSIASTYQLVTLTNAGNAYVRDAVFTFDALAAAGFSNLAITNLTTGESISSTRTAETDSSELVIDCSKQGVYYDGNSGLYIGSGYVGESGLGGGIVLADDYALVTRGASQAGFLSLKPGANQIAITSSGTPNFTFSYSFYGQYI